MRSIRKILMGKSARRTVLVLTLLLSSLSSAQADFAAGTAAYEAGDYATAYKEWLPLAQSGEAAAQRNLGTLFRLGQGVSKDLKQAFHWYKLSAEQNFDRAQVNLGAMYLNGEGTKQNYDEARSWFEKAAVEGNALAQYNLGLMYDRGLGVEKNEPKAVAFYYLAAKAGHTGALDRLAGLIAIAPLEKELGRKAKLVAAPTSDVNESSGGGAGARGTSAASTKVKPPSEARSQTTGSTLPRSSPDNRTEVAPFTPPPPFPVAAATPPPATISAPTPVPTPAPAPIPTLIPTPAPTQATSLPYVVSPQTAGTASASTVTTVPSRPGSTREPPAAFTEGYNAYRTGNYTAALARWMPLARSGDNDAQYYVGLLYRDGLGVSADRVRAHAWWSVAAKAGNTEAQTALGGLAPWMTRGQLAESDQLVPTLTGR